MTSNTSLPLVDAAAASSLGRSVPSDFGAG